MPVLPQHANIHQSSPSYHFRSDDPLARASSPQVKTNQSRPAADLASRKAADILALSATRKGQREKYSARDKFRQRNPGGERMRARVRWRRRRRRRRRRRGSSFQKGAEKLPSILFLLLKSEMFLTNCISPSSLLCQLCLSLTIYTWPHGKNCRPVARVKSGQRFGRQGNLIAQHATSPPHSKSAPAEEGEKWEVQGRLNRRRSFVRSTELELLMSQSFSFSFFVRSVFSAAADLDSSLGESESE